MHVKVMSKNNGLESIKIATIVANGQTIVLFGYRLQNFFGSTINFMVKKFLLLVRFCNSPVRFWRAVNGSCYAFSLR